MKGRPPTDPVIRDEAVRRYADGETAQAVADDLGVSAWSVRHWARQEGVSKRTPPEVRSVIVDRYEAGETADEIAADTDDLTAGGVRYILKAVEGVELRPRGPRGSQR